MYNGQHGPTSIKIDASRSSAIYGNSDTVQPNALTTRFIIKAFDGVTPTPAEADISEMLTELTGKADRDLDNLSADGKQTIIDYNMPDYDNGIAWSYPTAASWQNYTAPADGWVAFTATTGGSGLMVGGVKINGTNILTQASASAGWAPTFSAIVRVHKNDTIEYSSIYTSTTEPSLSKITFYPNKEVIV
jgi:hypothetical protein